MFKNYLKIALRNLVKNKTYSFINIFGLAIGMACTILILLWVEYELSYDSFHNNSEQIYQVVRKYDNPDGSVSYSPVTVQPLAAALKSEYPEIIKSSRFNDAFGEFPLKYKNDIVFAKGSPVDEDFFEIFSFPFRFGDATTALVNSNSIVITNRMAEKFFGENNPVGQTIQFELWGTWSDFIITGVIEDLPANSNFDFDLLFSMKYLILTGWDDSNWLDGRVITYIMTTPGVDVDMLTDKISDINKRHHPQATASINLQPLTKIHLYNLDGSGRIVYVYVFAAIAFFILIVSCINFINLSTACSEKRSKEVGVRKAVGAYRIQLGGQFLIESIVLSVCALIISLLFVELSIPAFNQLTSAHVEFNYTGSTIIWFVGIALFAGVVSGIYPSIVLSSSKAINILKGIQSGGEKSGLVLFRKVLVGFQFMLSIMLIVGVIAVHKQLSFIKNKPLGFEKDHIIRLALRSDLRNDRGKFETIKHELLNDPNVLSMTACNSNFTEWQYRVDENDISWEGKQPHDKIEMEVNSVDFDYLKTFEMKMDQGRFFSRDYTTDNYQAVILNETAVKALGMQNPVGQQFEYQGKRNIIGVVKDFNFYSLHQQVKPLVLFINPFWYHSLYIKISGNETANTIQSIQQTIKQAVPDYPFEYSFLDENLNRLYETEQNIGNILTTFSILAVLISCLGILGLVAFVAERRTKEVGIRKVLGASIAGVVLLLTKDFTKWIVLANIFAWPLAYYVINEWLQNFAYRIEMNLWMFLLSGGIALLIALVTVSYQAIKAATANPIESLKYE